jgi:hypothetical protein
MLVRALVFPVVLVVLAFPAATQGKPKKTPDAAAAAFAKGKQLFEEHKYVEAVEAFDEAYRLKPHFLVQCSIARCYENLNDFVRATEHYRRCLDEGGGTTPMAKRVNDSLQAVEAQIAKVEVTCKEPGGEVFVDGRSHGLTPQSVPINPGPHVVEVRREGARPARTTLKIQGGERRAVSFDLVDLRYAPSAEKEVAPPPPPVKVVDDQPEPPSRRRVRPVWFWAAAGATVALAVTGTALGIKTLAARSSYESDPTEEGLDTFLNYRLITNVVWGVTAAAAAGSTVLFFYTDFKGRSRDSGTHATLVGVGLRGSF